MALELTQGLTEGTTDMGGEKESHPSRPEIGFSVILHINGVHLRVGIKVTDA